MSTSVLFEAEQIINGERRQDYGGCLESFTRIAALWSATLNHPVSAEEVALCLTQLKIARAVANLRIGDIQRDSIVDIAGYAGCLEKIQNERQEPNEPA